jgi:hypothetical protein
MLGLSFWSERKLSLSLYPLLVLTDELSTILLVLGGKRQSFWFSFGGLSVTAGSGTIFCLSSVSKLTLVDD